MHPRNFFFNTRFLLGSPWSSLGLPWSLLDLNDWYLAFGLSLESFNLCFEVPFSRTVSDGEPIARRSVPRVAFGLWSSFGAPSGLLFQHSVPPWLSLVLPWPS